MKISLDGQVAVVTGGAVGLGREIGQAFAEAGADIVIGDISESTGQQAADEITQLGRRGVYVHTDVTKVADCRNLIAEAVNQLGRLDILVNNAGIYPAVTIPDTTEELWDLVLDLNLKGAFFCAQAAAAVMKERKYGRIISMSSQSAHSGSLATWAHYAASKGGIISMSKSFASYLAPHGVTVNCLAPGPHRTYREEEWSEEWEQTMIDHTPMGHLGNPKHLASTVLFLASEYADYITGATVDINGGWLMR